MKNSLLVLAGILVLSSGVYAANDDRVVLGEVDGKIHYGISHTKNFEIECTLSSDYADATDAKVWVDRNFELSAGTPADAKNYRVAFGWPEGQKVMGTVGAESAVVGLRNARCGKYCVQITLEGNDESQSKLIMDIEEVTRGAKNYTAKISTSNGELLSSGTCVDNKK